MAIPTTLKSPSAPLLPTPPRTRSIRFPRLYALADSSALGLEKIPEAVAVMARQGVRWIQIRAKGHSGAEVYRLVERTLQGLGDSSVELWIDDRVDIAALFPVAGVHVGQDDLPPAAARKMVGNQAMVGYSTHNEAQVAAADRDPDVDVIALGPIFETHSKERPDPVVGLEGLRRARRLTEKPLVAIGGINPQNLQQVLDAGADTVAVLGAICHGDVARNCERLLAQAKEMS